MSTTDSVVRDLTPQELALMRAPRGARVRIGSRVTLWQIDGVWSVWSDGPEKGTYWLLPQDYVAEDIVETLSYKAEAGHPVVVARSTGAIAVATKQIKPQALGQA